MALSPDETDPAQAEREIELSTGTGKKRPPVRAAGVGKVGLLVAYDTARALGRAAECPAYPAVLCQRSRAGMATGMGRVDGGLYVIPSFRRRVIIRQDYDFRAVETVPECDLFHFRPFRGLFDG